MKVNGIKIERPLKRGEPCGTHVIEEVYGDTVLQTSEGNQLAVCMRDDTFELNVVIEGQVWWHRVCVKTGMISRGTPSPESYVEVES